MLITLFQMATKIQHEGFRRTVYAYSNHIIYGVMIYFPKKKNMSKHNIILIIFKFCVYKITLTELLPNLKCTYDRIYQINK